jgi:uncharacterized membrane protein YdjX (TVP38/TMEM64 family)
MSQPATGARGALRRLLPLGLLLGLILIAVAFDLDRFMSFEMLERHHAALEAFVARNWLAAAATFILVYATAVSLSLPCGLAMTLTGGFLFGSLAGTALVVVGATIGAILVFLIARSALADSARRRAGPWLRWMEEGFRENAFSYTLVLRLVPLFPFFIVNLVPAVLGVPLRTYALATLLGIIPASYVYATAGAGLGTLLAQGEDISVTGSLTPEVVVALSGLGVLALLPVLYKRYLGRRGAARHQSPPAID